MRHLLPLFGLLLSVAAFAAEPDLPEIPFTRVVLKNGLTLIVHEDHKAPIVSVNVWYHVGSKNERAGKTGFAHLFEHLMFNGSEHYNNDYFKALEPMGATDMNGTTDNDRTNYFQNVPVSALDRLLWLESDRMGHLVGVIDKARLDEQRGVVQNEKRQGENQPYGKVWNLISENTFPKGHPYSWSVIGSMEDLNAASLDDVKQWFSEWYGPSNATLVLAGDITVADATARVEKYFGDLPPGPPTAKHLAWVPRLVGEHRMQLQDRVPQTRLIKVWNLPEEGHPDLPLLMLGTDVLGHGKSSRLYKRLVFTDRVASDAEAFLSTGEIASQLLVMASAQPGEGSAKVERAMDEEFKKLLTAGITPAELDAAKTRWRARFVRGAERIGGFGGKSDVLAHGQTMRGDPASYQADWRRAAAATPAEVLAAMKRWISDGVFVLEAVPFPEVAAAGSGADRSKWPAVGTPPEAPLPPVERATLSNGIKVVLARRTAVPMVNLSLLLDAGSAADQPGRPGLANLVMTMLDEGTTTRTATQLADELAALGANLGAWSSIDTSSVDLSVLKDRLDKGLTLWADVAQHPVFPPASLDRVKKNTLTGIAQEKVDPTSLALRVLPGLLYGPGHAYAQPLTGTGTPESVSAATREELVHFHQAWFKPNHATVVVSGDITMAELTPKLEKALGGWKGGEVPAKNIGQAPARSKSEVYLLDRKGSEQSMIYVGQLVAPKQNPDEFAFQTFNDAFGGAFVSRVNMNLREDKHWSYGAFSFAVDARGQRLWLVGAPVQTDKTRESLQELVKEFRAVVADKPLGVAEVADARARQTLTLAGRWETGAAVAGAVREIITFGLPDDYYATFAKKVAAVTDKDANDAAKKWVAPDRLVWVVVGDRAKIEAGVRALNLGELKLLDADGKVTK